MLILLNLSSSLYTKLDELTLITSIGTLAAFPTLSMAGESYASIPSRGRTKQKGAVGSWSFIISFANGSQDRSLGAFTSDGITIVTNERTKSTGFGVWESTGSNTFTYKFREPIYEPNGNLAGEVYVVQDAILNEIIDEFNSTGKGTVYDLNCKIIAVENTTAQATRIRTENF